MRRPSSIVQLLELEPGAQHQPQHECPCHFKIHFVALIWNTAFLAELHFGPWSCPEWNRLRREEIAMICQGRLLLDKKKWSES
jgi:hypothetical protein